MSAEGRRHPADVEETDSAQRRTGARAASPSPARTRGERTNRRRRARRAASAERAVVRPGTRRQPRVARRRKPATATRAAPPTNRREAILDAPSARPRRRAMRRAQAQATASRGREPIRSGCRDAGSRSRRRQRPVPRPRRRERDRATSSRLRGCAPPQRSTSPPVIKATATSANPQANRRGAIRTRSFSPSSQPVASVPALDCLVAAAQGASRSPTSSLPRPRARR